MEQRRNGSAVGGIVLILIGAVYLVTNLMGLSIGAVAPYIGPLVPVVLGFYFMFRIYGPDRKPGTTPFPWPLFMIFGGLAAIASIMGYWRYTTAIGPLAMIIVGGWLLFRRMR